MFKKSNPFFTALHLRGVTGFTSEVEGGKIRIIYLVLVLIFLSITGCGGSSWEFNISVPTQSPPYVSRIDPATASTGDTVIIYGFGFSIVAGDNIISFGSVATTASLYLPLEVTSENEIESLTVTVPDGLDAGDQGINVSVFDNVSNTDLKITITP